MIIIHCNFLKFKLNAFEENYEKRLFNVFVLNIVQISKILLHDRFRIRQFHLSRKKILTILSVYQMKIFSQKNAT